MDALEFSVAVDVTDDEAAVLVFINGITKVGKDESFLPGGKTLDGAMGKGVADDMQERKAIEEYKINA